MAILTQALNASGAANPMNPIQDFTATGTITYFWAVQEVTGPPASGLVDSTSSAAALPTRLASTIPPGSEQLNLRIGILHA